MGILPRLLDRVSRAFSGASCVHLWRGVFAGVILLAGFAAAPLASAQTTGSQYKVTRIGRDIFGAENYLTSQNIYALSPDGRYATGVRFGSSTRAFLITTLSPGVLTLPKVDASRPFAYGMDVNNEGDVAGYEKWTSGSTVYTLPWFYKRSTGTLASLSSYGSAVTTAIPVALTTDSGHVFGTVDQDGVVGPIVSQGVYWDLTARTRTVISGVREILDASADGSVLLVINSSGRGSILRGSIGSGWDIAATFGSIRKGKVSPDGRYVATSELQGGYLPVPFVYDTITAQRTSLALQAGDTLGATIGAISDTGRVLGSVLTSGSNGSFAVRWLSPTAPYVRMMDLLVADGHASADATYYGWNLYNGGDGISADGLTMAIFGTNTSASEDSMIFQQSCPVLTVAPTTLPASALGATYNRTVTASGGTAPYTYSVATGSLPQGLSLNAATGVISGTWTSPAGNAFTIRAVDANGCVGTRSYTTAALCEVIAIAPSAAANATLNTSYSQTFSATGGTAPYTWSFTGSLPPGLSLNAGSGLLSGTPTAVTAGTEILLRVTDSYGCTGSQPVTLVVCPTITLTPSSLSNGTLGLNYTATVEASSGTPPLSYTLASGSLPEGMTLNQEDGTLSGLPTVSGTATFVIRATDANGCTGTRAYSLKINGATSDYGDFNLFGSASSTVNSRLRLGALVDAEGGSITNDTATGDDDFGQDDEDGVTFSSFVQGRAATATARVTNTRGSTARLNMWIDWDGDGNLTSSEQVATNVSVSNGTNNAARTVNFTVPATAIEGPVGVRVRLSSTSSPGATGASGIGEVEDYVVHVTSQCPTFAVLVVNYNNNTMSRFSGEDGSLLTTWSPSGFSSPNYGYRVSDNTILVANGSANTVTKHNPFTGALISTVVPAGRGLNFPYQMAVAQDSSIFIANQNAGNVLRFDQNTGAILGTVLTTSSPAGLVFDESNRLYITQNVSGGALRRYDAAGNLLATIATWPAGEYPRGLAWGPDDRLYVNVRNNNAGNGRVDAISFPANTRTTFVTLDSGSQPYTGIKWGPDGNLYVVDYGENEMDVFSPAGELVRKITSGLNGPHAVAFSDCEPSTQDFGDYAGFGSANSTWSTTIRLGNETDTEGFSRANMNANGDDIDDIDDEDGVTMPATLTAGSTVSIPIKLLNTSGSTAYLSAWLDANLNGDLNDPGEKVISNLAVPNGTNGVTQNISITVPADAVSGVAGMRFRLSSINTTGPTGSGGTGEVEDYIVTMLPAPVDYGDHAPFGAASSIVSANLRIGTNPTDADATNPANATATGDDATGTDDEDTVLPSFTVGSASTVSLTLFNNSGASAWITGWIDWNGDGVLDNATERIIPETAISTSTAAQSRSFTVNVPANAVRGSPLGVRLRLSNQSGIPATGAYGTGEVEDYQITLQCSPVALSPPTLATAVTGTAYAQTITASGGTAPYTYEVSAGAIPAWAALDAATGTLTGTPNSTATASFSIRATDASGCSGTRTYTLTPLCPSFSITTTSLPVAAANTAYSFTLTSSGGTSPFTWSLSSGALPSGLVLSANGILSGTPNAGNGTGSAVTFQITDASGCVATRTLNLRVCPAITLNPSVLAEAAVGTVYSQTLSASGGSAPYVYSVSSGSLPAGLSLSANSGIISGTPVTTATASFTIRALDSNGCQGDRPYTLTPTCPTLTLTPGSLPTVMVGTAYSQTLTATGGTGPYNWAVSSGTLPTGLTLNATTGVISGTATTANGSGTAITVRATDSVGCQGSLSLTVKVCAVLTFAPTAMPDAVAGSFYSQAVNVSGGTGPYTYTVSAGSLPAGMSLNSGGTVSGTAMAGASSSFILRATDANGCTGTRAYTLSIGCSAVNIYPLNLPESAAGAYYSQTLSSDTPNGVQAEYYNGTNFQTLLLRRQETAINNTWGGSSPSSEVPADGFSARWTGAVIPPATGSYTFQTRTDDGVRLWVNDTLVIDRWVDQGSTAYTATVNLTSGVPATIKMEYYENGGDAVAQLEWSGPGFSTKTVTEWSSYQWSVASGSLPAGVSLDSSTGLISGTLTSAATADFTIRVRDWKGCEGTRAYTIRAGCPTVTISPATLPSSAVGTPYSQALTAAPVIGLTGQYYSGTNFNTLLLTRNDASIDFDWGSGAPATGLPSDVFSVRWQGNIVPATSGSYVFRTTADDGIRLWVNNVLVINQWRDQSPTNYAATVTLTAGTVVPIRMEFYENGGGAVARLYWSGPNFASQPLTQWQSYTWSVVEGSLPAGLTLNNASGVISGTPTSGISSTFTVRATDPAGCTGTRSYTLGPVCPALSIAPTTLPDAYLGSTYSQSLTASGGTAPYTWTVTSGSLPAGLSLAPGGSLGGTATATGTSSFTVKAVDAAGCTVSRSYTLTARSLGIGDLVWVDMNNDGLRQSAESGIAGLRLELWSVGPNGNRDNGAGDDTKAAADVITDSSGTYRFINLVPGSYYVRIPSPPLHYPSVSAGGVALDNGINNDSNAIQPGGTGTQVLSPVIALSPGGEPAAAVDGDDNDRDSTVDFGFANLDSCYVTNLFDNPSLEFQQLPNSTGAALAVQGYSGAGTSLGSGINAYQWVAGVNGTSGLGEPVQRVQLQAGSADGRISWVESLKSRHGRRHLLLQGRGAKAFLRAANGGNWSSVLAAGREYQISVWAANASEATAAINWELNANAPVFQVISGPTPGTYDQYTVPQSELTVSGPGEQQCCGLPITAGFLTAFGSDDYNGWNEAPANALQPVWRQFTWRFRVATGATSSQIDTASFAIGSALASGSLVVDYVSLCQISTANTLALGNQVWADTNNNGLKDGAELGISGVTVQLYRSSDLTAGNADDVLLATTTTSVTGIYQFSNLAEDRYVVKVTPPSAYPVTSGTPVTVDNGVNNDNNGSQPGGNSTPLFSPVITLSAGLEPVNDGDDNPNTDLSVDFGLFGGITVGNQVWADVNNDGVYDKTTEVGIGGLTVQLLNQADQVVATTTTNSNGVYALLTYVPGIYRVRIPTPSSTYPLVSAVADVNDNGEDNDSNALQPAGVGTAAYSPYFTLTAGSEPGSTGSGNVENTLDFGFRGCPSIVVNPGVLGAATRNLPYSVTLSATGGSGPYIYTISAGTLPDGLALNPNGTLSGTVAASAYVGEYNVAVRATDSTGCFGARSYGLRVTQGVITISPETLPGGIQYSPYSQAFTAGGGTSPYQWTVSPVAPLSPAAWWPGENNAGTLVGTDSGAEFEGASYGAGRIGNAFVFDGVNDVVVVADSDSLRPAQITVEAWVNPTYPMSGTGGVITKTSSSNGTNGYGLSQLGNDSSFGFWVNNRGNAGSRTSTPLTAGVWQHVVGTYDGTALRLYVNGQLVATTPYTAAINHSSSALLIGGGSADGAWKGGIDEALIYGRALAQAEIQQRYAATTTDNQGMPQGLSLNGSTGTLSGTPTSPPGTYTFHIRASDAAGTVGGRQYSLVIGCPAPVISPSTLPNSTRLAAYGPQTLTASGGTAPYTWALSAGTLPAGITLSSAGVISGTPTASPGTYNVIVQAVDVNGCETQIAYNLRVQCSPLAISPTSLPVGQQFAPYAAQNLSSTGGTGPYTYTISSGSLPTGLALTSGGSLSGTPTAVPGSYAFVIRSTDSVGCSATRAYNLTISCPVLVITPASLPAASQNQAYSQTLTATNGNTPYTWAVTNGSLPSGLNLSQAGLLSGTVTAASGTYSFTVTATDARGCTGTRTYSLPVACPVFTILPATLPQGTLNTSYNQSLSASGGQAPYTWASTDSNQPPGITLSSAGVLSGTPTSSGSFTFAVTITDGRGCVQSTNLTVAIGCPVITMSPPSVPSGVVGVAYDTTLSASGGSGSYVWSVINGSLPSGLQLVHGDNKIVGDGTSYASIFSPAGSVTVNPPNGGLLTVNLGGTAGPADVGFWSLRATGGASVGLLGLGLLETGSRVALDGSSLKFQMSNNASSLLGALGVGTAITASWEATATFDNPAAPIELQPGSRYTVSFLVDGSNGLLQSGIGITPNFTVELLDGAGNAMSSTNSATLINLVGLLGTGVTSGTVNLTFDIPAGISPGAASLRFKGGAVLNTTVLGLGTTFASIRNLQMVVSNPVSSPRAKIIGTPLCGHENQSFTLRAMDANGCAAVATYTIPVNCAPVSIVNASLPDAAVGQSYLVNLEASGGLAPYTWTLASGSLPAGLSLASTGGISGVPTVSVDSSFVVRVTDTCGCATTKAFTLRSSCPAITVTPAVLPQPYLNSPYSQTLTATGGTGPFLWTLASGELPAGLTLTAAGVIQGTPLSIETAPFTVSVTDAYGCTAVRAYSVTTKGLSVGNLIFNDVNLNGLRDAGEAGVSGAVVQLWTTGADNAIGGSGMNADAQAGASVTTGTDGAYAFTGLAPGYYYVRVIPPATFPLPGANGVNLDNGVDNDSNSVSQPGGAGTAIFGPVIQLTAGSEPTADDGDPDTDHTVDFGLFRGMGVGNLVFQDSNDNARRDAGEPGIDGVPVELWSTGPDGLTGGTDDVRLSTSITSGGGSYRFSALQPGTYYVRIPVPPQSHPLSSSSTVMADNQVDDDDNGHQLAGGPVYSPVITLTPGSENAEGGYVDTTIDFGLCSLIPSLYLSATHDDSLQVYDPDTREFKGIFHQPFGNTHNQGDGNPFDVPYGIEMGPDGNWYVAHFGLSNLRKISPGGQDLGPVLDNSQANVSFIESFAIGPDGNFYVVDHNGQRVVRFHGPLSASPGLPMGSAPFTFINQAGIQDLNFGPDGNLYLVIQDGALREVRRYSATTGALLNTVVTDVQLVNMVPGGQAVSLISGIDIHGSTLYGVNRLDGEIFKIDLSTPTSPGQPELIASITSAGAGWVEARDIEVNPATGKLYLAGYNWAKPTLGGTYATGAIVEVDPANAPNGSVHVFEAPIPTPPGPNNEIWSGPRSMGFGRPFVRQTDAVSIGSLVWNDLNANGRRDAGERGIPGVRVELWQDSDLDESNGAEVRIGWTFTDERGSYYFSGQLPGRYQVRVPAINFAEGLPLAGSGYSTPITTEVDNQEDDDDNGMQEGGAFTDTTSPLITLSPGTEPLGNAVNGVEAGSGGDLDDYTVDANGDMTVDFGFVEPGFMGIGNLVFNDLNGNRRFDTGEGVDDVLVQLYYWGQTPGIDQPIATTITSNGGKYLFDGLWQGQYFVHLPAEQFLLSGVLRGLYSLEGTQGGDDDQGEDSVDSAVPMETGLSTGRIILTRDSTPTNADTETGFGHTEDDLDDANTDLTVDFGLFRPVAIGNLVFIDGNSNGRYDPGEGLDGITLQLFNAGQTPGTDLPLASTVTASGGLYLFDFLRPGNYIVHVPKAMFASDGPLFQLISIQEGLIGDDDVGEDGVNAGNPVTDGVSTEVISVVPGIAPTDSGLETGLNAASDNENDAAVDLTIDFGFQSPVGVGNLVFVDANANGIFDSGEGVEGVRVEIYRDDQTPGVSAPLFSQTTGENGHYFFNYLSSGSYVVHIPASEFAIGKPLAGTVSLLGSQTGPEDDDQGEDGIDDASPALNGISSRVIHLAVDDLPINSTGESGFTSIEDDEDDNNFDLTIDFGFAVANPDAVGLGNLVFRDGNANGIYDEGEGVNGVRVQLFQGAADPLTATPLGTVVTASDGIYLFGNLSAGEYIVHIPPSEFAAGRPLYGWQSIPGQGGDFGLDDDLDENGSDEDPLTFGVTSTVITLTPGQEPENFTGEFGRDAFMDDANDTNTDLTVDFGFTKLAAVGNLVFIDQNYNGKADDGEGVPGVEVQLFENWMSPVFDLPLATVVTDSSGFFRFSDLTPGSYFLHVPYYMFMDGQPLHLQASMAGTSPGDDDSGEDGMDDGRPDLNGIRSTVFTLNPATSPSGTAESGLAGSSDDANDTSVDLTRDFGFVPRMEIGNLVFADNNANGVFDSGTETGIDGVTVELWSNSPAATAPLASVVTTFGGTYSFHIAPGSYHVRVPASQFGPGAPLENRIPAVATPNSGGQWVDDNVGQDAFAAGNVQLVGARTTVFALQKLLAPTSVQGEAGYLSESDDAYDTDGDLTIDLGFAPKPLAVGNLVFADVNGNGRYDAATDFGVPGVLVQLFALGDSPGIATPQAQTYTRNDGTYELRAPIAGSYFLHIPATQFTSGAPLSGATTVPGFGDDDGTDDDGNEDTLNAPAPASTGVNSIVFDLQYGQEPLNADETGFAGNQDARYDADADMTIDLGFANVPAVPVLGIGNAVFKDINGNGRRDAGEGVQGVWMQLYRDNDLPGQAVPFATTFTDEQGRYLFSNLPPGNYTVHVPADNFKSSLTHLGGVELHALQNGPLFASFSLTGVQSGDDDTGEDGIDTPVPALAGISSGLIALQPGQSPAGGAESGFDGDSDDARDSHVNLTVDFGFTASGEEPGALDLGLGNVVFADYNENGVYDLGEGVEGVLLHLYRSTDVPGVSLPLKSTTTDASGRYLFTRLQESEYIVHVAAANFRAEPVGVLPKGALVDHLSITGHHNLRQDDHLGEDGVDAAQPALTGISSSIITLAEGLAPAGAMEAGFDGASDNAHDADYDLTVDFGFIPPAVEPEPEPEPTDLGIGNVVFKDLNRNGRYNTGEGVSGVQLELYRSTDVPGLSPALQTTTTDSAGRYLFRNLQPGSYLVHVTAANFSPDLGALGGMGALYGHLSLSGHQASVADDHMGEDGVDALVPLVTGISSTVIHLQPGTAPTGSTEGGFEGSSDDSFDANYNLTIDFGFVPVTEEPKPEDLGLGNLVFKDLNKNGRYDSGEAAAGVSVQLYKSTDLPGTSTPLKSTVTDSSGRYLFSQLSAGSYIVHIPAINFTPSMPGRQNDGPLYNYLSVPDYHNPGLDDNLGEDGQDAPAPAVTGISSSIIHLAAGTAPAGNSESGFDGASDDDKDLDYNLTIDFGFVPVVVDPDPEPEPLDLGIGNVVFKDTNGNGRYDDGEGVIGVSVHLYRSTDLPGVSAPLKTTTTGTNGHYLFSNLQPGGYIVHIPADNFRLGVLGLITQGPLFGSQSIPGHQSTIGDDNLGEDGVDSLTPLLTGISSSVVNLQPGNAPTGGAESGFDGNSDNGKDADYNLTIDFGFVPVLEPEPEPGLPGLGIGNLIFRDANNNGRYNAGEGVSGVVVYLYRNADLVGGLLGPLKTTTTDGQGRYLFTNLPADTYVVHIPAANFKAPVLGLLEGGPLYNLVSVPGHQTSTGDDNLGEDGVDALTPLLTGVSSSPIQLQAGTAPTGSAEGGFDGSSDDDVDSNYNLTIDFGFIPSSLLGTGLPGLLGAPPPQAATATSTTWSSLAASLGAPGADLDGDGLSNLVEYALGTDPVNGLQQNRFYLAADAQTGRVDAFMIRPTGGRRDIAHQLELTTDLRENRWQRLAVTPVITQNNDGTETLRYADVASSVPGETGFVRLKVNLDADMNGTPEHTVIGDTQAWLRRDFSARQTFSMPLLGSDVFRGRDARNLKSHLTEGRTYYLEVLEGNLEGSRYELDEAATSNEALAFEAGAPALAGVRVAVRPHWTLNDLFPADAFTTGTAAANADNLLFFDSATGSFTTTWLGAQGWMGSADGRRILAPGEGMMVHVRQGTVPVTYTGGVRTNRFAQPIHAGAQLIGSGLPLAHSVQTLGLTVESGFTASPEPQQATRVRLWNGDSDPAAGNGYRNLYLHNPDSLWLDEETGTDISTHQLMQPGRAWFLVTPDALPGYREAEALKQDGSSSSPRVDR